MSPYNLNILSLDKKLIQKMGEFDFVGKAFIQFVRNIELLLL